MATCEITTEHFNNALDMLAEGYSWSEAANALGVDTIALKTHTERTYTTKSGYPHPSDAVFLCLSPARRNAMMAGRRAGNKIPFGGIPDWASFGPVSESRPPTQKGWQLLTNQKEASHG